jgi:hypothetical protein
MGRMSDIHLLLQEQVELESKLATAIGQRDYEIAQAQWEANFNELRRWFSTLEIRKMMSQLEEN